MRRILDGAWWAAGRLARPWRWAGLVLPLLLLLTAATPEAVLYATDPPTLARGDQSGFPPAAQVARGLRASINLLGYDPIWNGGPQTRFKLGQFRDLRQAGFTGVRVNLLAFEHMDTQNRLDPAYIQRIVTVAAAALAQGLTVIIDEHDHVACRQQPAACGYKLQAFWKQVAPRLADAPPKVVFEVMNEPGGPWSPQDWNVQLAHALATIRQTNPNRAVIVGPACSDSFRCLDQLVLPEADRNLIVTFHYYEPLQFTHQGTTWNPQFALLRNVGWGSAADRSDVARNFDTVKAWATRYDRPIFLGEFGAFDTIPEPAKDRYVASVARAAESRGFGWAFWQFEMNFALYDLKTGRWDDDMLAALFPQRRPASPAAGGGGE